MGEKLLPLEGLVVFKAHLKGGLFRSGSVQQEASRLFIDGQKGGQGRRAGEGRPCARRRTKERKLNQTGKCT